MALNIGKRLKAAFDMFQDPLTGRGSRNDRTQRLQGGGGSVWGDQDLYDRYTSNGFMQRVIEGPADDSTREGFKIESPDQELDAKVQQRYKELGVKQIEREMVKYSGIYPKGCAAFIGVIADNLDDQMNYYTPMPDNIRRVDYLNLLQEPGEFTVHVRRALHPTAKNYKEVYFTVGGVEVHRSRMLWISNEFNPRNATGISRVNTMWDSISAQDSALWSVSHLMQVLSMLVFKSDEFVTLPRDEQAAILKKVREWIDTSAMMGLSKDEELERVNVTLGGLDAMFEFIWKNIAGTAHQPASILTGKMQGVLTAGQEDLINYYNGISEFQEDKIEPEDHMLIDLLARETQGTIRKPGVVYNIKYNTLWELSPSLQAEVDKKNAERDKIDVESGKVKDSDEIRVRDPYYSVQDQEQLESSGEKKTRPAAPEDKPPAKQTDSRGSLEVDGKRVNAARIAFDRVNLKGEWDRMQIRRPGLFKAKGFSIDARREDEGVLVITGKLVNGDQLATQSLLFKQGWTEDARKVWADTNLPGARHVVDYDSFGISKIAIDQLMQADDVETTEKEIRIRLKSPSLFDEAHGFKSQKVADTKDVRAIVGRLKGKGGLSWQSLRFDREEWTEGKAKSWVKKKKITGDNVVPEPKTINMELLSWREFEEEPLMNSEDINLDLGITAWQGVLREGGAVAFQSIRFVGDNWTKEKAESWLQTELVKVPEQFAKLEAARRIAKKRSSVDA